MKVQWARALVSLLALAAILGAAMLPAGPALEAMPLATSAQAAPEVDGWQLAFGDEFDAPALDTRKWTPNYWWGNTISPNHELEYYSAGNIELSNGVLRLRADKRQTNGLPYTSGMVSSHGKFNQTYGYFEMRAKVPKGKGLWPAFWLLPDLRHGVTWPPEIDTMEILGHSTNTVYLTYHRLVGNGDDAPEQYAYTGPDFSADFHTYGVEWNPSAVIWYIDGLERARSHTPVPAGPMYVLANLAVGGDWPGAPDGSTPFPNYFDIDYIRVYRKVSAAAVPPGAGAPVPTLTSTPEPTATRTPTPKATSTPTPATSTPTPTTTSTPTPAVMSAFFDGGYQLNAYHGSADDGLLVQPLSAYCGHSFIYLSIAE